MQLTIGLSTLLVSILCATSVVDALPMPRNAGMITLPLRRVERRQTDLHPRIVHQQHLNRALKRHARMRRAPEPTQEELAENILRRAASIEAEGGDSGLAKRYFTNAWMQGKIAGLRESVKANKAAANKAAANKASTKAAPNKLVETGKGRKAGANNKLVVETGKNRLAAAPTGKGSKHAVANEDDTTRHGHVAANVAAAGGRGGKGKDRHSNNAAASGNNKGAAGNATAAADGSADADSTADQAGPGFNAIDLDAANNGGLTVANDPADGNSLGLDIEANDIGYIATIQMGTPPQDFHLLMDSGSADLWVGGENCQSTAGGGCGNHTFLGTTSSSTFVDSGNPFSVEYGSGAVNGTIVNDNIVVAGLKLDNHTFGVATSETDDFSADTVPFDGLMGLGQSVLSQEGVLTPPESLAQAGLINDAIVSYKLSRLTDNLNDGEITFGGLDSSKFDANTLVTFDNVNTQGFWEGDFTISVDGTDIGLKGRTAILDTGTSLIVAPADDAATFHDNIPGAKPDGQGGFTIPCTTSASVAFTFAGQSFDINPQDLLFVPVDSNDLTGDCVSAVSSGDIGGPTEWLVGDVFLKNAYFSTDVGKNQISLAKLT